MGSNPTLSVPFLWLEIESKYVWRGDRVVEGARLELVCRETYRGFESLSLRQNWGFHESLYGRKSAMRLL